VVPPGKEALNPTDLRLARELHGRWFTLDTHLDTPTARFMRPGWDFAARHAFADDGSQCDLPRMAEGGLAGAVFAVYVGQAARTPEGLATAHARAVACLQRTHEVLRANATQAGLALTADDGPALQRAGRRAIYLSLENAYSLGRDAANVARFHALGVRMIGLNHMLNNDVADSSTDPRGAEWGGLSPFGREVVVECNRLGITLDASHASDDALADLLELSRAPVILSHSGPRAVCDHPRNVGDELLRELAAKGGVLQINALPISLVDDPGNRRTEAVAELLLRFQNLPPTPETRAAEDKAFDDVCSRYPNPPVSLADVVHHIEHAAEVMGTDHVGIGFDLDGGGGTFDGLRDVADYPNVTAALLARGWDEARLEKLWGLNSLRLMRAVEAAAG